MLVQVLAGTIASELCIGATQELKHFPEWPGQEGAGPAGPLWSWAFIAQPLFPWLKVRRRVLTP